MTDAPRVRALRGATTLDAAHSQPAAARDATQELLRTMLDRNDLVLEDVISVLFTLTPDLQSAAPARAAREAGWHEVPMLTATEAPAEESLPRCIRVLMHVETTRSRGAMRHVFLHDARALRPDLLLDAAARPGDAAS